jgi:hypothetical protein
MTESELPVASFHLVRSREASPAFVFMASRVLWLAREFKCAMVGVTVSY